MFRKHFLFFTIYDIVTISNKKLGKKMKILITGFEGNNNSAKILLNNIKEETTR